MLLAGVSLGGPAAAQAPKNSKDVKYSTDKFTGAQYWETRIGNFCGGGSKFIGCSPASTLLVRKVIQPGDSSYLLVFQYRGSDWAFLRGPSQWVVDGQRLTIGEEADGANRNRDEVATNQYTGVGVEETAYYHGASPDLLERLAGSSEAAFRFPGERHSFQDKLGKKDRERIRRFLDAMAGGK
jgi:hypothetical protein